MFSQNSKKNPKKKNDSHTDAFCDVANIIPQIVWIIEPEGRVTYYNKRWYEYTGFSPEGKTPAKNATHPDDYKKNIKIWKASRKLGKMIEMQFRFRRKDGVYRWFLVRMVPMKKEGKLVKWIGTATDIDDHRKSEIKSQENEERLKLLMDSVKGHAIFMADLKGKITSWGIGAEEVMGYKASEVIGENFSIFFTEDDRAKGDYIKELKNTLKKGRIHQERQCVRKGGETFWASSLITCVKNKYGRIIGFTVVLRDINERKLAFDALHESEERFRMLVEEIRDYVMIMLDVNGNITTWNKGVEYILGYKASDIIGKSINLIYTKESLEKGQPETELKKALIDGRSESEGWRVRKDKTRIWANDTINAVRNKQGKLQGFVQIIKDMTAAKKSEEMLKKYTKDLEITRESLEIENAEDEALLESIGEGVVATNEEGRIVLMNRQAQTMFGVDEEEVLGKMFFDIWTSYDEMDQKVPIYDCPIATVLKIGKKVQNSTYYYVTHRKKKFPAASTTAPVILNERTVGTITVFRDIRKEKEVDRAKSEFVSLASHQLRTPLTAIKLFVEMLISGGLGKIEKDQIEVLQSIEQSNEKMIHLVDNLLNVSHIETGKLKVQYDITELNEFIKNCIKDAKPLADSKESTLTFKSQEKQPIKIVTDQNLMRQVLNNLITNAIQYSPEKSKILIQLERDEKRDFVISVHDRGIGIPKEAQAKIFERFYRAENALKAKTEGTGLGLYMCKIVMETLGGKIWCRSQGEGKGTAFYVSLPNKVKNIPANENGVSRATLEGSKIEYTNEGQK